MTPVVHALVTFPPLWFGGAALAGVPVWMLVARLEPHGWRHSRPSSPPPPPAQIVRVPSERIRAVR